MKIFTKLVLTLLFCFTQNIWAQTNLPECKGEDISKWNNCFGILDFVSGASYSGGFKNGTPNGIGTLKARNGDVYVGQYVNGKENGQGTYTYLNGDIYVGQFKESEFHGQGTYTFASGDKYVGQYKNDKRDGQGVMTLKAGGSYSGQWKDNLMSGRGTYIDENGAKLVGIWAEGKLIKDESPKPPPTKIINLICIVDSGSFKDVEFQYSISPDNKSAFAFRGVQPTEVFVTDRNISFKQGTINIQISRLTGKFSQADDRGIVGLGICKPTEQIKPKF